MASGGGGGGCACPGQSKLSSITTTKHAVSTVPAILLGRERGERGRVVAETRAVPGRSKPGKMWSEKEQGTGRYPAAAKVSSQLPGCWARAGMVGREGGAGRSEEGLGGAGRGEANCTARGRLRACGCGHRAAGNSRGAAARDRRRRGERRTQSAWDSSWQPSPAARSLPLYTRCSGTTTAEGLQAQAR